MLGSFPRKQIRLFFDRDDKLHRSACFLKPAGAGFLSRIFIIALHLLILFAQTGCAPQLAQNGETQIQERVRQIKHSLAAIRGLQFAEAVPIRIENTDVIRKYLEAELIGENGEEKLKNTSLAYSKLGLFPAGINLKHSLLKMYAAQVQGFYDLVAKNVVLPAASGDTVHRATPYVRRASYDEKVLAHELTHALQDQHFALGERLGPSNNSDKTLAFRAVAEGDANLTELLYHFGGILQDFSSPIGQISQSGIGELPSGMSDVPAAIADKLLFQYQTGMSFVKRVFTKKGWPGVNRLYSSPPLSTEQMLHPEKYLDAPDPPTIIELRNLSCLFPAGWTEVENNTLGELMVQSLFSGFVTREEAMMVAGGWDGDRFVAFRRGDEISFIWVTAWDSPQDAEEFYDKYQLILSRKYPLPDVSNPPFHIEKRGHIVVVTEGVDTNAMQKCKDGIWQAIALREDTAEDSVVLADYDSVNRAPR